jgi:beta-1,4-mannosyltransferase
MLVVAAIGTVVLCLVVAVVLRPILTRAKLSSAGHGRVRGNPASNAVAAVVVGGDFARSPRMQYHAASLCECGRFSQVRCVGFDEGNKVSEHLAQHAQVRFDLIAPLHIPRWAARNWIVRTTFRVGIFCSSFLAAMWRATAPVLESSATSAPSIETRVVLLIQTPPAVPFLVFAVVCQVGRNLAAPVLRAFSRRYSTVRLVVDFHNFGYTLLEIDRRPAAVVSLYRALERYFGAGDLNLTVSDAMRGRLTGRDGVVPRLVRLPESSVVLLRDYAPDFFKPMQPPDQVLGKVRSHETLTLPTWFYDARHRRTPNTLALISATSWTADDDYSMVVEALQQLDVRIRDEERDFNVWLLVTGKGESRQRFEDHVAEAKLSPRVQVSTHYFQSFSVYAAMLSLFDAGLCVHRSSSGLDLPMKCVDMFGAGLPVFALEYPALAELVDTRSGWIFSSAGQLADQWWATLSLPEDAAAKRRHVAARRRDERWAVQWNVALSTRLGALLD